MLLLKDMAKKKSKSTRSNPRKMSKRLVAAAPHLLWACYSILSTLEEMELGDVEALDDVRRAIARATGVAFKKI